MPVIAVLKILEFFKLSPLYKWVYETACQESFVSVEKAEKVLGFVPKFSNQDALIRNYQWYLDNLEWCNRVRSGDYQKYYASQYGEQAP